MKLKTPYVRQATDYFCGPAALAMVFGYFERHRSQFALAESAGTTKDAGTLDDALLATARREGFYCYVNHDATLNEIIYYLTLGLPAIIAFVEPSEDEAHHAVVIGYGKKSVILNDPWNGKHFRLRKKEFLERWRDKRQRPEYHRGFLVLSKAPFSIGKQYPPFSS